MHICEDDLFNEIYRLQTKSPYKDIPEVNEVLEELKRWAVRSTMAGKSGNDRILLDFANNTVEFDCPSQRGVEHCPDLSERKNAIISAMGYCIESISDIVTLAEDFINGKISIEEFNARADSIEKE